MTASNNLIKSDNLSIELDSVTYKERIKLNNHKGAIFWLTGLSGAGKSTIAQALQRKLFNEGKQVIVLDGDNIRKKLNRDLGFNKEDRSENIRRIAEIATLLANSGLIVITSFISPYENDRQMAKKIAQDFINILYVKSSLSEVIKRDVKGLYKMAKQGKIKNFTGIDDEFEEPINPDLIIDTEKNPVSFNIDLCFNYIKEKIKL